MGSRTFTFDWRASEQAQDTNILAREMFGAGVWRIVKWVIFVFGFVSILTALAVGQTGTAIRLAPWQFLGGFWIIFFAKFHGRIQAWQMHRLDPNVRHPFRYTLEDSGLHIAMQTTNVELKWDGLHKVRETRTLFMFYYNARCAYFLPKRAVGEPRELDSLRAWMRRHIPDGLLYQEQE